jgi:hypothetical protein
LFQQAMGDIALMDTLQFGELNLAVDAQRFPVMGRLGGSDFHVIPNRTRHDIGQVILFLRIVIR